MSDEWQNGYRAGYEAGFEAAKHLYHNIKSTSVTQIHDPGNDTNDIERVYEKAYGKDIYEQMKKAHDNK